MPCADAAGRYDRWPALTGSPREKTVTHRITRRRCLLAGSATLCAAWLPVTRAADAKPPVALVAVAHDTYFGDTLADPYRWMENDRGR